MPEIRKGIYKILRSYGVLRSASFMNFTVTDFGGDEFKD